MRYLVILFLLFLWNQLIWSQSLPSCLPQQIHLSLADAYTFKANQNITMKLIFQTQESCRPYVILTDPHNETMKLRPKRTFYRQDYGNTPDLMYMTYTYVFDFVNLEFGQVYEYTCYGGNAAEGFGNQGPFKFYTPSPTPSNQNQTRVVMFADMDHSLEGITTINRLVQIARDNFTHIDAFIHNGDMAYNLDSDIGKKGDSFMNAIQNFTTSIPYMVTAGNHEYNLNFSNFNMRFRMPWFEETSNHFYSFHIGNIHFISFNLDLVLDYPETRQGMLDWLEQDLQKANMTRDQRPWIVAFTHRPFYCSFIYDVDCETNHQRFADFEQLLNRYQVDLVHGGHVHAYERMLPMKEGVSASFQYVPGDKSYRMFVNPQAPIHLLQGMAGHGGDLGDAKGYDPTLMTIKVDRLYSFLQVTSLNGTHLLVENIQSNTGKPNDYFFIVKSDSQMYTSLPVSKKRFLYNQRGSNRWKGTSSLHLCLLSSMYCLFRLIL